MKRASVLETVVALPATVSVSATHADTSCYTTLKSYSRAYVSAQGGGGTVCANSAHAAREIL